MKTLIFLAILTLGSTALAGNRHHHSSRNCGYSHGGVRVYSSSYYRPYYGSSYGYRSYPYRSYPYRSYNRYPSYYRSGFYLPAISFTYTSSSPRYYNGYSRSSYNNTSSLETTVQRELKRRGYYRGALDGDIGPESRAAIRSWQYERGLATTGRIDNALLRSLGL